MRKMLPGVGVFGNTPAMRCYIPILKSCGLEVVALWARTAEEARQMSDDLGIPLYTTDVDKVLLDRRVDLVVISCSPHIQAHIAAKALGIGKHVLCSLPSGPRSRDTLPMVHASRYYPRLMSLMCNGLRFLPSVVKMRRLIKESGFVGTVTVCEVNVHYCSSGVLSHKPSGRKGSSYSTTAYDWTCDEAMGGGVLNLYGGMVVDILSYVTGLRAIRVQGMVRTFVRQTERVSGIREITSDDFCSFQMELGPDGACATVTLNSQVPGPFVQEITVLGTLGRLTLRGADLYGQRYDRMKEDLLHFDPTSLKDVEALGGGGGGGTGHLHDGGDEVDSTATTLSNPHSTISTSAPTVISHKMPAPYLKGVVHMLECVRDAFQQVEEKQGWCPDPLADAATFEDCFYVQTVLDAVRTASKNRQSVKVVLTDSEPEPNPFLSTAMRRSTFSLH
ncbi:glucose-fructose oxidoreductase domain-containing protein 1 [Plakobranchus ocellatus]|uniref:Glucose-fructose oxidoreductase domain-containing protein 1 n=1 Tax=Plakobranchus ocellatus TaxID=259542 RepID=A0AAV3Z707_9GAST|nr:glucose-fructose oxidoreductase domain-containing protein 1 [Plakobranchus ocellatus]